MFTTPFPPNELINVPHIQYAKRLAESLICHEDLISPRRLRRVRKHFSAANCYNM